MIVIHANDDNVNMDVLFPIRDEVECVLQVSKEKSKDFDFRSSLVTIYINMKQLGKLIIIFHYF